MEALLGTVLRNIQAGEDATMKMTSEDIFF